MNRPVSAILCLGVALFVAAILFGCGPSDDQMHKKLCGNPRCSERKALVVQDDDGNRYVITWEVEASAQVHSGYVVTPVASGVAR